MIRHAVYFAPSEHSPLWRFGSSVLGFDAVRGSTVEPPAHRLFADGVFRLSTEGPARYGFHATLKAPFRLAPGSSAEALDAFGREFAARRHPFAIELKVAAVREYLALVPREPCAELDRLADDCVRDFDPFRAAMTPEDRGRRRPERLTRRELDQLDRWGYPFVFEDFWFHMTLAGPLGPEEQRRVAPMLQDLFGLVSPQVAIDSICLFVQDEPGGHFRVRRRFPFRRG